MMQILLNDIKLKWNTLFAELYQNLANYFVNRSDIKLHKATEALDTLDRILE